MHKNTMARSSGPPAMPWLSSAVAVTDATAAAQAPGLEGYNAALTNFRFLASAMWSTEQATKAMKDAGGGKKVASTTK